MASKSGETAKRVQPSIVQLEPAQVSDSSQASGPARPASAAGSQALLALLNLESQVRLCENEHELIYLIANETRKLTRARQVFVADSRRSGQQRIVGISSLDTVDRNVPLVRWVERMLANLRKQDGDDAPREFMLPAYCSEDDTDTQTYPFANLLWVPFRIRSGIVIGGMLLTREQPWAEADISVANRLADAYTFGFAFQRTAISRRSVGARRRRWPYFAAILVVVAQFIPVPLVVHAPVEVTPSDAFIIAAPIDGVVREISVEPNSQVAAGDLIVRFEDTELRNAAALAEEELHVAESRLKRITQASFSDIEAKRELRLAIAERNLKRTELDFAAQLLERATIRAERDGLAVFFRSKGLERAPGSNR